MGVAEWLVDRLPPGFWDKLDEIDFVKRRYGIPGPEIRPLLEQFSLIDSDAIRHAAEYGWGVGGEQAGVPANTAAEMQPAVQQVVARVAERWHGTSFDRFESTTATFTGLLPKLTAPCQEVGQQLVAIADAFEMSWIEILGWVATGIAVASTLLAVADIVPGDEVAVGLIATVLGAVSTIISVYVTFVGSSSRFSTLDDLIAETEEAVRDKLPRVDDAAAPALPADGWTRDSADPTS